MTHETMYSLEQDAIDTFLCDYLAQMSMDELQDYADDDQPGDEIHEIADTSVPVYTNQLINLAASDNSLATDEPELGPAFDGRPTPTNILAANVFERIEQALYEWWNDNRDNLVQVVADYNAEQIIKTINA